MREKCKLSILMLAYNQEKYIEQAIESAVVQKTSFPFELVIGEDCSTDGTRAIIENQAKRHPGVIRLLNSPENLGMMGNFLRTLASCRGDYIAILEGDDFWTSPDKLQKQVIFLDSYPEFSATFHNVRIIREDDASGDELFFEPKRKEDCFGLEDLVRGNFIPTCSVVFRNSFSSFPDCFKEMPMGDWPLHILNAEKGKYHYIDETLGSYRVHSGGMWSGTDRIRILKKSIKAAAEIDKYLDFRYHDLIKRTLVNWRLEILEYTLRQAGRGLGCKTFLREMYNKPFSWRYVRKGLKKLIFA